MDDITLVQRKDTTSIRIGEASPDMPRHLMTGEKACAYLVLGDSIEPWYFSAIRDRDGSRFIDFPQIDLLPFSEISGLLKHDALKRLRELAQAMQRLPDRFINPSNGLIETWRIFFLPEEGVFLLPEQLSQIILYCASEHTRFLHMSRYMRPNIEPPFGLCHQFTQFLYLAATGNAPYEDSDVREDRFRHVPLSIGFSSIGEQVARWIDNTLALKASDQRELVSAAYSAEANLRWFLDETASVEWNEPDTQHTAALQHFLEQQGQRARRRRFLRRKGALLATLTLVTILVISIGTAMIHRALQPPYTAGLSAPEVIASFFQAQNELDATRMNASLVRGVKNPFETEVSNLFVNSKVRQAYEGIEAVVRADRWLEEGMGPIAKSSIIYGVTDLEIEALQDGIYQARYLAWYPDQSSETPQTLIMQRTTEFVLTDRKGYWQIAGITLVDSTLLRMIKPEVFQLPSDMLGD